MKQAKKVIGILSSMLIFFISLSARVYFDTSFGTNNTGIVSTLIGMQTQSSGITVQSDGKIVAGGSALINGKSDICVSRFTTTGQADGAYGSGGTVTTLLGDGAGANSLLINNGEVIIVGYKTVGQTTSAILASYTSTGILDPNFGSGGIVTQTVGNNAFFNALALSTVQSTQMIVAAGAVFANNNQSLLVCRYALNGAPDTTFGTGGVVTTSVGAVATPSAIIPQADGSLIIVGSTIIQGARQIFLAHYLINGQLDPNFGVGGIITTIIPNSVDDNALAAVAQSDGKIVVTGRSQINNYGNGFVARYLAAGVLDSTFGNGGIVVTDLGSEASATSVGLTSDNKIIVTGSVNNQGFLAKYSSAGVLDTTFVNQGIMPVSLISGSAPYALAIQLADQKIVITTSTSDNKFVVARVTPDATDFITMLSPANGSTITTNMFTMSGISNQSNCTAYVQNAGMVIGNATTDSNGNWNAGTSSVFPNGSYTLTTQLMNGQSVVATTTTTFTVNASNDMIIISSPQTASKIITSTPEINGTSSQGNMLVSLKLDGSDFASTLSDDDGSWDFQYPYDYTTPIPSGSYTLVANLMNGATILATGTTSFTSAVMPTCTQLLMLVGTFLTSNPPVVVAGSGASCPPVCDFFVRRLNSNMFEVTLLPQMSVMPVYTATIGQASSDGAAVAIQNVQSSNKVIFVTSGKPSEINFVATSCLS